MIYKKSEESQVRISCKRVEWILGHANLKVQIGFIAYRVLHKLPGRG